MKDVKITESEKLQDELEPIVQTLGKSINAAHPTEHDESDDLEAAKRVKRPEKVWKPFNGGRGG